MQLVENIGRPTVLPGTFPSTFHGAIGRLRLGEPFDGSAGDSQRKFNARKVNGRSCVYNVGVALAVCPLATG